MHMVVVFDLQQSEGSNNHSTSQSLSEEISIRRQGFKRRAPLFSRTLRASTFTHPATSQYRKMKKLVDIDESEEVCGLYSTVYIYILNNI